MAKGPEDPAPPVWVQAGVRATVYALGALCVALLVVHRPARVGLGIAVGVWVGVFVGMWLIMRFGREKR